MKKKLITLAVFLTACLSIWLGAAVPQWIQYSERVVGENSPYYQDVVNRPIKQIWGNFTSQHTLDGVHRSFIFPTPIPTATAIPASIGDQYFTAQHTAIGEHTPFPTPLPTATPKPDATPIPASIGDQYFEVEHTALGIHTPFPTPLPTATPKPEATPIPASAGDQYFEVEHTALGIHTPFPTPLPTATPKPDATPQPTATPVPSTVLTHPTSPDAHYTLYSEYVTNSFYNINAATGGCYGQIQRAASAGITLYLPTPADIITYHCHTVRVFVSTNFGSISVNGNGSNIVIGSAVLTYTNLITTTTPAGSYIELIWGMSYGRWIVTQMLGTWTPS